MSQKILVTEENGALRITINRPAKRNCLDNETLEIFLDVLDSVSNREEVRCVVVRGASNDFSAGADLSMFHEAIESEDRQTIDRFIELIHAVTAKLETLPVPILAVIEGFALAGGLELLLSCDIRVATEDSVIGDQHANYGLVAGGGGTQRLIRQIDTCKANELMYTGRRLTGDEAAKWGIVNRAVPSRKLDEVVETYVDTLTSKSREASSLTKRLMQKGERLDKESALEFERQSVVDYYFSEDAKEGFQAFVENRRPEF